MNTVSALQGSFPLQASRKFQKKFLGKLLLFIIGGGAIGAVFLVGKLTASDNATVSTSSIIVTFLIPIVIIAILYGWYLRVYIRTYYYSADEHFLTIKKGVLTPSEIHVQYQKIQDVYVDQDILDRIFGLYDVHIASATASSGIEAHIDGVNKTTAEGLKEFLLNSIRGGITSPNGGVGGASSAPISNTPAVFTSTTEVSSGVYPLSSTWFWVTFFFRLIGSVIATTFIILYFFARSESFDSAGIPALIYIGFYLISFLWTIISLLLWKRNYSFKFNEHFLYFKEGIITIKEKNMPYSSIQDVSVSQNFMERIFGFAKVIILDATQGSGGVPGAQWQARSRGSLSVSSAGIALQGLSRADANTIAEIIKTTILNKRNTGANGL